MIVKNAAYCLNCETEIESTHRHDWVQCPCGSVFVDGGKDYLRRGGDPEMYEDRSEFVEG